LLSLQGFVPLLFSLPFDNILIIAAYCLCKPRLNQASNSFEILLHEASDWQGVCMGDTTDSVLRVAHVIGNVTKGGVEAIVFNYYRAIDRTRVQFDFIIDEDSPCEIPDGILELGCKVYKVPSYKHLSAYIRELGKIFSNYQIVHSHMNTLSVFALFAAKRAGVTVRIAHSHSTAGKGEFALFLYQYVRHDNIPIRISNWFISSCPDNKIIKLTLSLLYEYWHNHNVIIDYFLFHDFFEMAIECFPNEWSFVLPRHNDYPHLLQTKLLDEFNMDIWNDITKLSPLHKLTHRVNVNEYCGFTFLQYIMRAKKAEDTE
jgi:hypothetical protein